MILLVCNYKISFLKLFSTILHHFPWEHFKNSEKIFWKKPYKDAMLLGV